LLVILLGDAAEVIEEERIIRRDDDDDDDHAGATTTRKREEDVSKRSETDRQSSLFEIPAKHDVKKPHSAPSFRSGNVERKSKYQRRTCFVDGVNDDYGGGHSKKGTIVETAPMPTRGCVEEDNVFYPTFKRMKYGKGAWGTQNDDSMSNLYEMEDDLSCTSFSDTDSLALGSSLGNDFLGLFAME